MLSLNLPAQEKLLEVIGDFDGANPQSQDAIIQEPPGRYRLTPFNEEGSSVHYYFRFNTKVINHSNEPQDLELIVEWPALEQHPDFPYDVYYYGDHDNWKWTYASIRGTASKLHITVPPGTTYVGTYPRYNYQYFEGFMNKLPQDGDTKKWIAGKSYFGRNIWCVKITDAKAPDESKRKVLVTARNHPYETSGSYLLEEMILFLQGDSQEAERLRQQNIFYLMPMLNPDGVAMGLNQLTRPAGVNISCGVGTGEPAANTLLDIVDQVRPGIWADVHSWPQKNVDGMLCTHQWIVDGLLEQVPHKSFQNYDWKISLLQNRNKCENHLWHWLYNTYNSGGVSLSISWYRRSEEDMRHIGRSLVSALGDLEVE